MFSKEQGITVVAVCLAYDFFVVNEVGHCNVRYTITLLFLGLCGSLCVIHTGHNTCQFGYMFVQLGTVITSRIASSKNIESQESTSQYQEQSSNSKDSNSITNLNHSSKHLLSFFKRSIFVGSATLGMLALRLWVAQGPPSTKVFNM